MYTLADVADVERGWGLAGETFEALAWIERYGGERWFQLGDRDLATHLIRSEWLRSGQTLTEVTARLCRGLGVRDRLLPMSDEPCPTLIDTDGGTLSFQHWLVAERGRPEVRRVWSASRVQPSAAVLEAIEGARLAIIGPSNPYVSIDPILALPGVRERLRERPVLAVSPIVHGRAVKGPLAEMLRSLDGAEPNPASIVRHYAPLVGAAVVERGDEGGLDGLPVLPTSTLMPTREHSRELAQQVLQFARHLGWYGV
jgi:LPPG:FO 2-phospho-L-lactate transferase